MQECRIHLNIKPSENFDAAIFTGREPLLTPSTNICRNATVKR